MNEEITGSCKWDVTSHLPSFKWANWHRRWHPLVYGLGAAAYLLKSVWNLFDGHDTLAQDAFTFVLSSVFFGLAIKQGFWGEANYIRALQKTPGYGNVATWVFTDEGREERLADKSVFVSWEDIQESKETPDGVLLFVEKGIFTWIPKQAFSASDYKHLIQLIASKTQHSKVGLN